jgi:hypothetical protein
MDKGYVAQDTPPGTFDSGGHTYLARAPKTMANTSTAWWDASQLYGFDDTSRQRVKRDPADAAKLLLVTAPGQAGPGYLPVFGGGRVSRQLDGGYEFPAQPVRART